jgi:hypothetical protein
MRRFGAAIFAMGILACPPSAVTPDGGVDGSVGGSGGSTGTGGILDAGGGIVDSGPPVIPLWVDSDVCGSAFARATALGCRLRKPDSGTWTEACRVGRKHGLVVLKAKCASESTNLEALSKCLDCLGAP